jgi:putative ABC transport system permease protein
MRDDLRQAVRFLWRRRGVTALAAAVLAAGIGGTTLIFSVADAALFKSLPYVEPSRLVDFKRVFGRGTAELSFQIGMPTEEALAWRSQSALFAGVELYGNSAARILTSDPARAEIRIGHLSIGMLPLLGVNPERGRGFAADEGIAGHDRVTLLSQGLWRRRFGADPAAIGRTIELDGIAHTVIGIMPASLHYQPFEGAEAWVPFVETPAARDYIGTVARLRPGLSLAGANREVHDAARWIGDHLSRKQDLDVELYAIDGWRPADQIRTTVLLILGASAFLLLIACANVGNMLLALSISRRREIAVRRALGASRARIVRQALAEGLLLAGLGGAGGLLLTEWGTRAAPVLVPARLGLFSAHDLQIDARVTLFALAIALLTGILASLAAIVRRDEPDAAELQGRSGASTPAHGRARGLLIGGQVALTLVLLIGAGLLAVSFAAVIRTETGFKADGLGFVDVTLPERRYPTAAQRDAFFDELVSRVRRLPGIAAAAQGMAPPIGMYGGFVAEGAERAPRVRESLQMHFVGPDYFEVAGITLQAGRALTPADSVNAPPAAVISARAALRHWPDGQALGKRFRYSPYVPWITVVGIAGDVKTVSAAAVGGSIETYLPYAQNRSPTWRTILFRPDTGDAAAAAATVRAVVASMDPTLSAQKSGLVTELYDNLYESPRFFASLMSLFAVVALLTAAIGLGASLMYTVSRRTREIGVRMALGADAWHVRRLVLRDALGAVVAGVVVGLIAALWLADLMRSMLYGITSRDPLTIAGAAAVLLASAAVACYMPARRATQVDPMIALRAE